MVTYKTLLSIGAALAMMATPAIAAAQSEPGTAVASAPDAEPDEGRLAAANRLVATMSPEEREAARMQQMLRPLFSTLISNLSARPDLQEALKAEPRAAAIFQRFTTRVQERAIRVVVDSLPEVRVATARAYARRFTVEQMDELNRFFSTPVGQYYLDNVSTITADPDIQRIQSESMQRVQRALDPILADLAKELEALAPKR